VPDPFQGKGRGMGNLLTKVACLKQKNVMKITFQKMAAVNLRIEASPAHKPAAYKNRRQNN